MIIQGFFFRLIRLINNRCPSSTQVPYLVYIILHAFALGALGACTSIRVEGADALETGWAFAPIFIRPAKSSPVTVVRSQGLGWVPHGDGFTLGFHKELRVMLQDPDACRLIVLEPESTAGDYERLMEIMRASGVSLCSISKESK